MQANVSAECWLSKESHSPEVTSTPSSVNMPWRNNTNKQQERLYGDSITNKILVALRWEIPVKIPGWPSVKDIRLV